MRRGNKASVILLAAAKEKHIYNLEELSRKMHICYPTMSKKINDPSLLRLGEAKQLSKLTGLSLDELSELC